MCAQANNHFEDKNIHIGLTLASHCTLSVFPVASTWPSVVKGSPKTNCLKHYTFTYKLDRKLLQWPVPYNSCKFAYCLVQTLDSHANPHTTPSFSCDPFLDPFLLSTLETFWWSLHGQPQESMAITLKKQCVTQCSVCVCLHVKSEKKLVGK